MLFVFLALYVALGIGCIAVGIIRSKRSAVACGIIAVAIAAGSLIAWILYVAGATHWTISALQAVLSPMPESLVQPDSLESTGQGIGVPVFAVVVLELIVSTAIWAIPVLGIVSATRAPQPGSVPRSETI
ncbi:hypothetical protein NQ152_08390 [Microbacterium sp. zg.B48]|uniref:hypothetical protein n=1 Tax=Microbacterium sp. zg.B48 TaxID=2969408 RepID=UPI00214C312C|nr:hypothetical protein [Microbacterium sp. zg.B48]MCR2763528.1 hypothetical protein [Microbacterium sp. zg.B48]